MDTPINSITRRGWAGKKKKKKKKKEDKRGKRFTRKASSVKERLQS